MVGFSIGSLFFNSSKTELTVPPPTAGYSTKNNAYGITLTPSLGWFITDRTVVGALINFGIEHRQNTNEASGNTFAKNESNATNYGIGGFARNYFSNNTSDVTPFAQLLLSVGSGSLKNEGFFYNGSTYKDSYSGKGSGILNFTSGLSIGVTKIFSSTTGLDLSAGYTFSYSKNTVTSVTTRDVDIDGDIDETYYSKPTQKLKGHGFSINLGFQVIIERKKS